MQNLNCSIGKVKDSEGNILTNREVWDTIHWYMENTIDKRTDKNSLEFRKVAHYVKITSTKKKVSKISTVLKIA